MHVVLRGTFLPQGTSPRDLALLMASGIAGLVLGDAAYFRALVLIGPAQASLMVTASPAFATVMASVFLDERLPPRALGGITLTVAGILLAVWARSRQDPAERVREMTDALPREETDARPRDETDARLRDETDARLRDETETPLRGESDTNRTALRPAAKALVLGLVLALLGTLGQATGQVLARPALARVDPLSATVIRIMTGAAILWIALGVRCAWTRSRPSWWNAAIADRRALALTMGGVLTGPSFGVWLSQIATRHAQVGIAATLMSLIPIFVMLEDWALGRRRPTGLELLGAGVAVGGVGLLVS